MTNQPTEGTPEQLSTAAPTSNVPFEVTNGVTIATLPHIVPAPLLQSIPPTDPNLELLNSAKFMLDDLIEQFAGNRSSRYVALAHRELEMARHWIEDGIKEIAQRNSIT